MPKTSPLSPNFLHNTLHTSILNVKKDKIPKTTNTKIPLRIPTITKKNIIFVHWYYKHVTVYIKCVIYI